MSHVFIGFAIIALTTTFFIWIIDSVILSPDKLVPALRSAGVPGAIATIIPEQAAGGDGSKDGNKDQGGSNQTQGQNMPGKPGQPGQQQGQPNQPGQPNQQMPQQKTPEQTAADAAEKADMKAKIAAVVTPAYVDQKLQSIVESTSNFIRYGKPQPTLDLSDFPAKLRASGVTDVGEDIDKNFAKPIQLNEDGKLDKIPQAYSKFKLLKYAGIVLFAALLGAEWLLADKGKKLQRAGRIFLHAGLWYLLYYVLLVFGPSQLVSKLKGNGKVEGSIGVLVDAFVKAIQNLLSVYLLGFAIACLTIAIILYIARHAHRHVKAIESTPNAPSKAARPVAAVKPVAKPTKNMK